MLQYQKYHRSFLEKLGIAIPNFSHLTEGPRIWIHSGSVGETRSVASLARKIQKEVPNGCLVISTTTETGQAEAKRSIPDAQHFFYLPLDFSWNIKRVLKSLNPDILILVENDFWFNLIRLSPRVLLVNGSLSEKSFSRFKKFSFFTKKLFRNIDLLCVQNSLCANRFERLGIDPHRIVVTGNLKLDVQLNPIDVEDWKQKLGVLSNSQVIAIGSTHEAEEEMILTALAPLLEEFPHLKILIAPRHPERFSKVARLIEKKQIAFSCFSSAIADHEKSRVILIDALGVLPACYQIADFAVVGGSFVPHVGGHNIFEPIMVKAPVLFGPYMHKQQDIVSLVTQEIEGETAGRQVTIEDLKSTVKKMLLDPPEGMKKAAMILTERLQGSVEKTWRHIQHFLT